MWHELSRKLEKIIRGRGRESYLEGVLHGPHADWEVFLTQSGHHVGQHPDHHMQIKKPVSRVWVRN
jgi:hypothetical protein